MRLSTVTNIFRIRDDGSVIPLEESLKRCYEIGFRVFDISLNNSIDKDHPLSGSDWEKWIDNIANEKEKLGIEFASAHLPFFAVDDKRFENPEERAFIERAKYRSIHACSVLGVKWAVEHISHSKEEQGFAPRIKQKSLDYVAPFIEAADKGNVGIAFENMITGMKVNYRYLSTAWELVDFVDSIKASNVGICWDFGHANFIYMDQSEPLRILGKRLKATHVHDNWGTVDSHVVPFQGTIQWEPIMKTLDEIGYEGEFTFEVGTSKGKPDTVQTINAKHIYDIGLYLLSLGTENGTIG